MLLGIIGKPSSGKTTFFNAATEASAKTASYPFTTIEPNRGISWVRVPCPHREIGVPCSPRHGFCLKGNRFVPVDVIDVAGLVPGAHEGRGLGNKFLDDLRQADVFIHVVDASGSTDAEGNPVDPGSHDPAEDVEWLRKELLAWLVEKVKKAWEKTRNMPGDLREKTFRTQFTGLGIDENTAESFINKLGYPSTEEDFYKWADAILQTKPMLIAANKIDVDPAPDIYKELRKRYEHVVPTSALAEYTLRKAASAGYISYVPGDGDFQILRPLTPEQRRGLEYIRERVLEPFGSTGVQEAINEAVLGLKKYKVVFPVENEEKWTDSKGNVLPDAFLLPPEATALDLAFAVHTDLGKKFIAAVDARTKRRISKEYVLKHLDIIKIVAGG